MVDEFCKIYLQWQKHRLIGEGGKTRLRDNLMSLSEMLTVMIIYHTSPCREFKFFYLHCLKVRHKDKFPIASDKGYISKSLFDDLFRRGLKIITGVKTNMRNYLFLPQEKILLRKRSVIESVFKIMKNHMNLEHTRHRLISWSMPYPAWLPINSEPTNQK